jgi:hypothetical protein
MEVNPQASMNGQTILSPTHQNSTSSPSMTAPSFSSFLDVKPKMEPLHLQHLHQMSTMGFGYDKMSIHHHPLAQLPPTPTSMGQSQHQQQQQQQSNPQQPPSAQSPSLIMG